MMAGKLNHLHLSGIKTIRHRHWLARRSFTYSQAFSLCTQCFAHLFCSSVTLGEPYGAIREYATCSPSASLASLLLVLLFIQTSGKIHLNKLLQVCSIPAELSVVDLAQRFSHARPSDMNRLPP